MPRLRLGFDDQQLNDDELREAFSSLASDAAARQIIKAIVNLIGSGDLGFWLSPKLARQLRAFVDEHGEEFSQNLSRDVDQSVFLAWLEQGGCMEPNLRWELESLPNNGSIYRILLEGGKE